jgi:uncharacterized protein (TIGR00299 family) protein
LRILYFDCFSGASGDMILGALIDAGVPLASVRRALGSLAIEPEVIWTERVSRAGLSATKFCVRGEDPSDHAHDHRDHDHDHGHRHHGHDHAPGVFREARPDAASAYPAAAQHETRHQHHGPHRTLAEIFALIDGSALSATAKDRAQALFQRLGEAEAAVHGIAVDRVHLHEVGALDSIIDIVGAVHAMEALGADRIVASPLNVGSGTIRSAHGLYPVPAPATARLLQGVPIYSGKQAVELVTPTGALLVTAYAESFGAVPPMRIDTIGYGAGSRDLADTPNVLRVLVGESAELPEASRQEGAAAQSVVVIEAEIDDMNPQIFGVLMDQLLAGGALDVFYTPIQMKKYRPGTLLTIVAPPDAREPLTTIVFRESTTIGVRYREMQREVLDRDVLAVATPLGEIRFKVARRDGRILNASPEFDDCVRIARERDVPVKDVQAAATKAFLDRGDR